MQRATRPDLQLGDAGEEHEAKQCHDMRGVAAQHVEGIAADAQKVLWASLAIGAINIRR